MGHPSAVDPGWRLWVLAATAPPFDSAKAAGTGLTGGWSYRFAGVDQLVYAADYSEVRA